MLKRGAISLVLMTLVALAYATGRDGAVTSSGGFALPAGVQLRLFSAIRDDTLTISSKAVNEWRHGDAPGACTELFDYFCSSARSLPAGLLDPLPAWSETTRKQADDALVGLFTLQSVTGNVTKPSGDGFNWASRGPNNDPEFAWFLNRLQQIPMLFVAWRETGDERYRRALNSQLRDWLKSNPRPAHYSFSPSWRALEVARRSEEAFLPVLFAPQAGKALDPDVYLAVFASLPEHAAALRDAHAFSGNHIITEMTALAAIALACPEFKESQQWLAFAVGKIRSELAEQIYPDGAQAELSNVYQNAVLLELQRLTEMLKASGRRDELAVLSPAIENAWNYYAFTLDPRGHGPLNNDASIFDDASPVRDAAASYKRADWLYVATNGREGKMPAGPPSRYFPWAGLAVMRGGWDSLAQWAYFELGPHGIDHQHDSHLHLSIGGGGREFLVDDGRYNYMPGPWRDYFTGPRGHNVALLDGKGTVQPPMKADVKTQVRDEITGNLDFFEAAGTFASGSVSSTGPAYHERAVLYPRNEYWIVADRILAAGPHRLDILWHFHPECTVKRDGPLLYTEDAGVANAGLLAVGAPAEGWGVELIKGRGGAQPQGWYSPQFNYKVEATCADFSGEAAAPLTVAWIIWIEPRGQSVPASRPHVMVEENSPSQMRLRLTWPDGRVDEAAIPFGGAGQATWKRVNSAR